MVLDLHVVVAEMATMLRRLIGEDIQLVTVSRTSLGRIKADRGQLEQVVMNLAVNARDAMPGGGQLTIETANVDLDERDTRRLPGVRPGPAIMLAVGDTGTGMEPEVRAHLFEPFFTTKGVGKGTGLGLATVYGIVKQSGGAIAVDTAPGRGTTFRIYLPRVEEPVGAAPAGELDIERCRGTETILIVEDEATVRAPARTYLQALGYTVLEAGNGPDALRLIEAGAAVHLMVSDVVMPGMAGPELARRFRTLRPDVPILLTSGYSDQSLRAGAPLPPDTEFLQKPFTPESLVRRIRHLLDAA
jgi:CheY-like chemotaxis protein